MIFHHTFGLYALPPGTDTAWISPGLTHNAAIFKICVAIFIFITGYAMGWKPAPSAAFGSLFKTGFLHYFKFWKLYLFCLLLILLVSSAFPTPMLPSPASLNWQDWILTITGLQPLCGLVVHGGAQQHPLFSIPSPHGYHAGQIPSWAWLHFWASPSSFNNYSSCQEYRTSARKSPALHPASSWVTCAPSWQAISKAFP